MNKENTDAHLNECCKDRNNLEFDSMPCAMEFEEWFCNVCDSQLTPPISVKRWWEDIEYCDRQEMPKSNIINKDIIK